MQRAPLQHGYRLIVEREMPAEAELATTFPTPPPTKTTATQRIKRHPSWVKLHFIRKHLHTAKFLVWMDADVLVMNLRVPLSVITGSGGDLTGKAGGASGSGSGGNGGGKNHGGGEGCALWACQDQDLVAAKDWKAREYLGVPPNFLINAGVLAFRDGAAAQNIVESAWQLGKDAEFIPKKYDLYYDRKPEAERGWPWWGLYKLNALDP
jgi:hypothetical protein